MPVEKYIPGNHPQRVDQSTPTQDVFNKSKLGRLVKNRFVQTTVAGVALIPGAFGGVHFAHSAESNTVDNNSRVVNSQSISSADKLAEWDAQVLAARSKQQEFGAFFKGLEGKTQQQVKQIGDYVAGVAGYTPQESTAFINSHPEVLKAQRELGLFFKGLEGKTQQQVKQIGDYVAGVADKNGSGASENDSKAEQSDTKLGTASPSEAPRAEISQTITGGITGIVENRTVLENNSNKEANVAGSAGAGFPTPDFDPGNDVTPNPSETAAVYLTPSNKTPEMTATIAPFPTDKFHATATPTSERKVTPTSTPNKKVTSTPTKAVYLTPGPTPEMTATIAKFPTPEYHATATNTATATPERTAKPTLTNTPTETKTQTPTKTNTPTLTSTAAATETNTPTATNTETSTPVKKATKTPTATYSPTLSPTPTRTPVIEIPREMPNTGSGQSERVAYGWLIAALAAAGVTGIAGGYSALRLRVRGYLRPLIGSDEDDKEESLFSRLMGLDQGQRTKIIKRIINKEGGDNS